MPWSEIVGKLYEFKIEFPAGLINSRVLPTIQLHHPRGGPKKPPFGFRIGDQDLDGKKRIGVHATKRFIAGSPWNLEKTQKSPQAPPTGIRIELRAAEIKPPRCQHGVQLTKEEFEANNYEFGRLNKNERPTSFDTVLLRS